MTDSARASRRGWLATTVAIIATGIAAELMRPLNWDAAWLLYCAQRVLQGGRLYVDLVEINPPLIVWLNLAPAWASLHTGLDPILALRLFAFALLLGCLLLANRLIGRLLGEKSRHARGAIIALTAVLFFLWPRANFLQREHLAFALMLPYLLVSALRVERAAVMGREALLAGALAALGFLLKPHLVLVWIAVGVTTWARTRRTAPRWPIELRCVLAGIAVYAVALLAVASDYVAMVRRFGAAYLGLTTMSPWRMLLESPELSFSLGALLIYGLRRRSVALRGLGDTLAVACAAAAAAAVVQQKGYLYHFLPMSSAAALLLAVALASAESPDARWFGPLLGPVNAAAAALVPAAAILWTCWSMVTPHPVAQREHALLPVVRAEAGEGTFLKLGVENSFPLVIDAGVRWGSRFPMLWCARAFHPEVFARGRTAALPPLASMSAGERTCLDAMVEDWGYFQPRLVLVPTVRPGAEGDGHSAFDYLGYLSLHPAFAAQFARYRPVGSIEGYRLYVRR